MSAVAKADWSLKQRGPEEYAPRDRGPAIHSENQPSNEIAERMAVMVGQAAGASLDQIDHVARELEKMRDMMRSEAERIGQLIENYGRLSNGTIAAMKIISENLKPFQRPE
jgi:DNA-binding ferritin-like protein